MSTDDVHRLPPLENVVNDQDQSCCRSSLPRPSRNGQDRRSARRHRQGPQAARTRGRSEATSLARCRAQIEHRLRDGRRTRRSHARSPPRAHQKRTTIAPRADAATGGRFDAEPVPSVTSFPHERDQLSGRSGPRSAPPASPEITVDSGPSSAPSSTRHRHRQPWRERPLRTGAGPIQARAPGSLTPWFLSDRWQRTLQWAAKNAAHRARRPCASRRTRGC